MFHCLGMNNETQKEMPQDAAVVADKAPPQKLPWQPPVIEQFDVATVTQVGAGGFFSLDFTTYAS